MRAVAIEKGLDQTPPCTALGVGRRRAPEEKKYKKELGELDVVVPQQLPQQREAVDQALLRADARRRALDHRARDLGKRRRREVGTSDGELAERGDRWGGRDELREPCHIGHIGRGDWRHSHAPPATTTAVC